MKKWSTVSAAAVAGVLAFGPMTSASAQSSDDVYPLPPPDAAVQGLSVTQPQVRAIDVTNGQELPVTGGDIVGLVMLGGAAIGTGAILVRRGRRAN